MPGHGKKSGYATGGILYSENDPHCWFVAVSVIMTNSNAKVTNSFVKMANSIASGMNSTAKVTNYTANGTKVTNSIANTCKSFAALSIF